ncbi:MAG: glycoside hydrolase family 127 protein [Armatimonadetes bacterium]|nr:glycoside hydrolase family 127 protein [Armatimonadota bacterium]
MTTAAIGLALVLNAMGNGPATTEDALIPLEAGAVKLQGGLLGDRYKASIHNRLVKVGEDDLLDCFERRDAPHQDWQGEHVGKFLHAATLIWAVTGDPGLRKKTQRVVERLIRTQEPDGYLGTYPKAERWTKWDVWVHKYNLIGLLTYSRYAQDGRAATAAKRIGDLLVRTFGVGPGQRDINKAGEHVGMAATSVLEPVVLLARETGDHRYLEFARWIVDNYDSPGGPAVLKSLERTGNVRSVANAKAYEMTSNFVGLLEFYRSTRDKRLLDDVLTAWNDITGHRLYVTGSGSNRELWTDDRCLPNDASVNPNETCVTVTWEQLNHQLLRITGESKFADRLEQTVTNHLLGAQRPDGGAWAYYSALKGTKPYGSTTNCCVSSGPRGLALLPFSAVMTTPKGGLVVNLFTDALVKTKLDSRPVSLKVETAYPDGGDVDLILGTDGSRQKFPLWIRIPGWAKDLQLEIDGREISVKTDGHGYVRLERSWSRTTKVSLRMHMGPWVVEGTDGNAGQVHVRYGPCVMALDTDLNPGIGDLADWALVPSTVSVAPPDGIKPAGDVRLSARIVSRTGLGRTVLLTPFAFAGRDGRSAYTVWMRRAKDSD